MLKWLRAMLGGGTATESQERWWDDAFPDWAAPLETPERFRSVMNLIDGYFHQQGVKANITPDGVQVGGKKGHTFGYQNLFQSCAGIDAVLMRQRVIEHFDALQRNLQGSEAFQKQLEDWSFAKDRLRLRLWDETYFDRRIQGIWRKDIPGLLTVLSIDSPDAVMTAAADLPAHWKIQVDELYAIALANSLAELCPGRHAMDETRPDGPVIYDDKSFCFTSLVLDASRLQEFCGVHGAFIALPIRHIILTAPFQTLENLNDVGVLHRFCLAMHKEGPGSLSERVWWVKDGAWIEIEITIRDGQQHVKAPDKLMDYLNQVAAAEGGASDSSPR